jgi:hypothetical protein
LGKQLHFFSWVKSRHFTTFCCCSFWNIVKSISFSFFSFIHSSSFFLCPLLVLSVVSCWRPTCRYYTTKRSFICWIQVSNVSIFKQTHATMT